MRRAAFLLLALILITAGPALAADPGSRWIAGPTVVDQASRYACLNITDSQGFCFNHDPSDGTGKTLRILQTTDFFTTLTTTISVATGVASAIPDPLAASYVPSAASFVISGVAGGSSSAFLRGSAFAWAFSTVTGGPAGAVDSHSITTQGSTMLAALDGATAAVVRSTDFGVTWTSVTISGLGALTANKSSGAQGSLQAIASPSAGIWLVMDATATVFRSVNDGTAWSAGTRLTTDTTPRYAITCLDRNTCIALTSSTGSSTVRLFRSTDGGATWAQVFSVARTDRVATLVSMNAGVVVALSDPTAAAGVPFGYRSSDGGATWGPIPSPVLATPIATATFVTYITGNIGQSGAGAVQSIQGGNLGAAQALFCTAGVICGIQGLLGPSTITGPSASRGQLILTSGSLSVPSNVSAALLSCTGGGGGGSGSNSAVNGGGGGGGGGLVYRRAVFVTPGSSLTATIGPGGPGGASTVAGTDGTATTITGPLGNILVSAPGGIGGLASGQGGQGAGGSQAGGSGGGAGAPGSNGARGTQTSPTTWGGSGGGGGGTGAAQAGGSGAPAGETTGTTGGAGDGTGGGGGSGGTGFRVGLDISVAGAAGGTTGAGSSAAANSGAGGGGAGRGTNSGGAGGSGICLAEWVSPAITF